MTQSSPDEVPTDLYQDNVVIVLDASGSMDEPMRNAPMTRMQAAKQALLQVLDSVPDTTNVGLVVFSARNLATDWVYPLGRANRDALRQAVLQPEPGGNTPLGAYLKIGADALLRQRQAQRGYGTFRLLVVTDGEATDQSVLDAYLPDVLSRGVTVDVIGVDMAQDHALATRVHSYRRADSPQELERAVSSAFAEVGVDQDDTLQAEQFELIQPLPAEMADRMLAALTTTGNHPIGEEPGTASATGGGASGGPAPLGGGGTASGGGSWAFACLVAALLVIGVPVIVMVVIAKALGRQASRGRRR